MEKDHCVFVLHYAMKNIIVRIAVSGTPSMAVKGAIRMCNCVLTNPRIGLHSTGFPFGAGDAIYADLNGDGVIDLLDVVYLGDANPDFEGGFGILFVYLITFLPTGALHLTLSLQNIALGFGVSAIIGTVSGIVPAAMGARMDPVVAIRT